MGDLQMDARFLGVWELHSFTRTGASGDVHYPYGEDARGIIMYSPDAVSYQLAARREPFASGDFTRATSGELAAAAAAFRSYVARWSVEGDTVTHAVFLSFHVDREGSRLQRKFAFTHICEKEALVLEPIGSSDGMHEKLVWTRLSPS